MPLLTWGVGIVVKPWWQDERQPNTELEADVVAKAGRLVVLDLNGVLLGSYRYLPEALHAVAKPFQPRVVHVNRELVCCVRADAEQFLQCLKKKAKIIVWSCCRRKKLNQILKACFPELVKANYFAGKNALFAFEVSLYVTQISNLLIHLWHVRCILTRGL